MVNIFQAFKEYNKYNPVYHYVIISLENNWQVVKIYLREGSEDKILTQNNLGLTYHRDSDIRSVNVYIKFWAHIVIIKTSWPKIHIQFINMKTKVKDS